MKTLTTSLLIVLIAGCSEPEVDPGPAELARQAVERAEARYLDSQKAGHAWSQTRIRLESAKQALEAADYSSAEAEAEHAVALASASLAQAQAEQSAWRERFPSDAHGGTRSE